MTRDAYQLFFDDFFKGRKDKFFEFGLNQTIYADLEQAKNIWETLKHRLLNNEQVYIRRYGAGGSNTQLYRDFYTFVFNNENIAPGPSNNARPRKLIESLIGYMKALKLVTNRFKIIRYLMFLEEPKMP